MEMMVSGARIPGVDQARSQAEPLAVRQWDRGLRQPWLCDGIQEP